MHLLSSFSCHPVREIAIIQDYLQENYEKAYSLIKVDKVEALLIVRDKAGNQITTESVNLEEGRNSIPFCNLNSTKGNLGSVEIKIVSFHGAFSEYHLFK